MFDAFDLLIQQGSRAGWLEDWLLRKVWSAERYRELTISEYLKKGEMEVNKQEEIIARAAPRIYDEFLNEPPEGKRVMEFLEPDEPRAVVIFDGLSLRESPVILQLAAESGFDVKEASAAYSLCPSDTMEFIEKRLSEGRFAPSQLPSRKSIRDKGILAYYYKSASQQFNFPPDARKLLLWSAFPDITYSDNDARFAQHFEQVHAMMETAWQNIIQQIPRGFKILITSDHGYVFFGSGMSFNRTNDELRPLTNFLGGERFKKLEADISPPVHPDLKIYPHLGIAVLKGRVQTHPPGGSSAKLYKHGGLSIMEMMVPWIVLEAKINA